MKVIAKRRASAQRDTWERGRPGRIFVLAHITHAAGTAALPGA